ncbi:MAG: mechanosensitive ion channel family protein [Clostridia bacterium]|nr:mechanosensitive ion channel family protein [Clostridia bacterium]
MEKFTHIFTDQWEKLLQWWGGLTFSDVIFALLFAVICISLARPVANWLTRLFAKLFRRWPTVENGINTSLRDPLRAFIVMGAIVGAFKITGMTPGFETFLDKTFRIANICFVTWALMNFAPTLTKLTIKINERNKTSSEMAIRYIANIFKLVIVLVAVCIIISELGYNINGIITGLGLGGLTLSLAAKNTASNLFAGFEIVSDRPFDVGDKIRTPSCEGTVEDMTMRSTRIRTSDDLLIIVPNAKLMEEPITNVSAMGKRFVKTVIGVVYDTPSRTVDKIIRDITKLLEEDDRVDNGRISVAFLGFGDSSLDIQIIYFTKTTDYDEYLKVNEELNYKIRGIVEENGSDFAYPTSTLYVEPDGSVDLTKKPTEVSVETTPGKPTGTV